MKISKFFSAIFALLGVGILVATVVMSLGALDAEPQLVGTQSGAQACSEELMEAFARGDYAAAQSLLYGQPDLGVDREPADAVGKLLWDAFVGSLSYTFAGECYASSSGVVRDVTVTTLDLNSVTASLGQRAQALLEQRVDQAENMDEIYGADNNYREDLVAQVLQEAAAAALAEDAAYMQQELTLNLVFHEDRWWVAADQALLKAVSGGVA